MKKNVLAQLENVQSTITSTLEVCLSSKKIPQLNRALETASEQTAEVLASIADHPNKRSLSQTKKRLTVIGNLLSGLIEGLQTRELKVADFRAVCSTLQTKFIPNFVESINEEAEKFKSESGNDYDVETVALSEQQEAIRDAVIAAGSEVSEDELEEELTPQQKHELEMEESDRIDRMRQATMGEQAAEVERRMIRFAKLRNTLPESMKTPYTLVRLPVVPTFETEAAKNPHLLEKLAIPFTEIPLPKIPQATGLAMIKMQRYVIFEQQMILCVSKAAIENILEVKESERDDENADDIGGKKAGIKALKAKIAVAEAELQKAYDKFPTLPKQAEEIKRLEQKINELSLKQNNLLKAKYTPEEAKIVRDARLANGRIHTREGLVTKLDDELRNGKIPHADYVKRLTPIQEEIAQLKIESERLAKPANKIRAKYLNTADLKKREELINTCEKKLSAAQEKEAIRVRLIPEAEAKVERLEKELSQSEDKLKDKRKVIKRSGAPITAEDYARSVIAVINERSGSKYALVTPKVVPNPRKPTDILCFWIMPSSKLSALLRNTGGKAQVKEWDFPFGDDRHKRTKSGDGAWVHPRDRDHDTLFKNRHNNPKEYLEFLEYDKNKQYRPKDWKTMYKKPPKPLQ